jgi:signal transduction histidine kinase
VLLGAFLTNIWIGATPLVALGIAVGNTLEAVLGAYALHHLGGYRGTFDTLRLVVALIFGAAAVSTLVSATIGVTSLSLGGFIHSADQAVEAWRAWWVGDVLGDLIVAPLLLAWASPPEPLRWTVAEALEATALVGLLVLAGALVFLGPPLRLYPFEFPYVLFPLFVWSALRFELRGAAAAPALASVIAIVGTLRGHGPFALEPLENSLLALQSFMGYAAITPLVVGGAVADRSRAIRAQENLMASVSHDLKSPLNAVVLSGDVVVRKVNDPEVRKHHDVLRRTVDRMMRLIADILAVSAIERGQLALEPQVEDARSLVGEAIDLLRPVAKAKRVEFDAQNVQPIQVVCDRDRILQVLSNLVGNALKFCPEETVVTLAVALDGAERGAHFSVRDRGPGIAPAELRHVFERYRHATPTKGGGSGLGLFIAKSIVVAHGGQIWVESEAGAGTTLHFTLPAANRRHGSSAPVYANRLG